MIENISSSTLNSFPDSLLHSNHPLHTLPQLPTPTDPNSCHFHILLSSPQILTLRISFSNHQLLTVQLTLFRMLTPTTPWDWPIQSLACFTSQHSSASCPHIYLWSEARTTSQGTIHAHVLLSSFHQIPLQSPQTWVSVPTVYLYQISTVYLYLYLAPELDNNCVVFF